MTTTSGNFRLVILIAGTEVPAHLGGRTRDDARRLQRVYRTSRPEAVTRVRKVA